MWSGAQEGWGLTSDGYELYVSDGSSRLTVVDPFTFTTTRSIQVETSSGYSVSNLNELEYCPDDGLIYANIWFQNRIVGIDPQTGEVKRDYDLTSLQSTETAYQQEQQNSDSSNVLNGIAYDTET